MGMDTMTQSWIGGLRERGNATWPMCRLRVDEQGAVLGPAASWLGWLVPTYSLPWTEISAIHNARGVLGTGGVQFQLRDRVPATRRIGLAKLWPRSAKNPVFLCNARNCAAIFDATLSVNNP